MLDLKYAWSKLFYEVELTPYVLCAYRIYSIDIDIYTIDIDIYCIDIDIQYDTLTELM